MLRWFRVRAAFLLALICFIAPVYAGSFSMVMVGNQTAPSTFGWKQFLIGAGGLVSRLAIAPDNTMASGTDAFGGYYLNPSATTPQGNAGGTGAWQQYVTSLSMPSTQVNLDAVGVFEIAIAPSSTSTWYLVYHGYILKTTNKGQAWTQCASSGITIPITADANDQTTRTNGQKMAVDPADPNTVYLGTPAIGLLVSHDGCASWTAVSGITAPNSLGFTGIIFDPTSGTNGSGFTNIAYAHSNGTGTYHTTNGSAWSLISGSPTPGEFAAIDSNGKYYLVSNGADLWQYSAGTDTKKFTQSGIHSVAVKPTDPTYVIVMDFAGNTWFSTNTAGSFTASSGSWTVNATGIPWLGISTFLTASNILFDQSVSNRLHVGTGIGTFYIDLTANPAVSPLTWLDQSVGIEELVTNYVLSSPACTGPTVFSWDRPAFYKGGTLNSIYPSTYGPHASFDAGWSADYTSSAPGTLVAIMNWLADDNSGISTDCGQTWTNFAANTPYGTSKLNGTIAAASPTNIIWAPAAGVQPSYTKNGGTSWAALPVSGITTYSSWQNNQFAHAKSFCADRVSANTFYFYFDYTGVSAEKGVFSSSNSGDTWTKVKSTPPLPTGAADYQLMCSPDAAAKLYFTNGRNSNNLLVEDTTQHFIKSTDGGATWVDIAGGSPTVNTVIAFGFGKGTTAGVSALYIAGFVNHVYGIWRSYDDGATWTSIGTFPSGLFEEPRAISGDMNTVGRAYWGGGGSGYQYGQFNFLLKRDIDPAANDNDPMWLEKAA